MNSASDQQPPRAASRRRFLSATALGAAGLVIGSRQASSAATGGSGTGSVSGSRSESSSCLALTPTQEVGPFYVAYDRVRLNIRAGQAGVRLHLHIKVINVETCKPIHNAALDIWQANALGVYSDESQEDTTDKTYLRGIQLTDKHGLASFKTIVPGWYAGRVQHIHAKVRLHGKDLDAKYSGGTTAHLGQMFFTQHVNNTVATIAPYASNHNTRITNSTDRVYTGQGGESSHIALTGSASNGYTGTITLGVNA